MSTTPPTAPVPPTPQVPVPARPSGGFWSWLVGIFSVQGKPGEVVIISHTMLFYWWPVWLLGFVLAIVTGIDNTHAAFVPGDARPVLLKKVEYASAEAAKDYKTENVEAILTKSGVIPRTRKVEGKDEYFAPTIHPRSGPGIVYAVVLLITILITSIHMRGLWSVVVILFVSTVSVILALVGAWEPILAGYRLLNIHINMGGYLFISTVLFIFWLMSVLFFDRQIYVIVAPGQVRVRLEVGAGETVYDPTGMVFRKRRSDFFRHLFVGFGSGDLVIRPAQTKETIELPNVLRVAKRVKQIEQMLRERLVMPTPAV